jgi:hypothetical protein
MVSAALRNSLNNPLKRGIFNRLVQSKGGAAAHNRASSGADADALPRLRFLFL